MSGATKIFQHPYLGAIKGKLASNSLLQLQSLPYGSIAHRFSRSTLLDKLNSSAIDSIYDATHLPPASIQPEDSAKMDCESNQFPVDSVAHYHELQSEDCLRLSITLPISVSPLSRLPVIVFLHGGAFFIGSGSRPYYSPVIFCKQAIANGHPLVFVSVNYRLGALGFFHSPTADKVMPANNGLHDQRVAFNWIQKNIAGFGGDPANITAIGQSAGAESLSLHNLSGIENVWKRSVQFSGSLVTMPAKTPDENQEIFIAQAKKLEIDADNLGSDRVAEEMVKTAITKIRDLAYVGAPCTLSDLLPYDTPTMALSRKRSPLGSLQSQIVSSATFDGGISYNMMSKDPKRKNHAKAFIDIARDVLKSPDELLKLYELENEIEEDSQALRKICQFESDIGFFAASLSLAQGFPGKTHLLIFDLGNPFDDGPLPPKMYATHTWDIVSLLGAYEDRLDEEYQAVIRELRERIIQYTVAGKAPWPAWSEAGGEALAVERTGLRLLGKDDYMGPSSRRGKLLALAEKEDGEAGCDLLWSGVCRRFLMQGE